MAVRCEVDRIVVTGGIYFFVTARGRDGMKVLKDEALSRIPQKELGYRRMSITITKLKDRMVCIEVIDEAFAE